MELIPHRLTPTLHVTGIRSLIDFGNPVGPLDHSVLYLQHETRKAVPKYISGRTSYLQVRLEFLRYPQFIRAIFN